MNNKLKDENERKIKERLERSREIGGFGIDFGEVTLFTGSDGKAYKDLDKIDVVELAYYCADNKKSCSQGFCLDHYNSAKRKGIDKDGLPRILVTSIICNNKPNNR